MCTARPPNQEEVKVELHEVEVDLRHNLHFSGRFQSLAEMGQAGMGQISVLLPRRHPNIW